MSRALSAAGSLVRFARAIIVALLVVLIRAYQILLSPAHGPTCRFQPTCSNYAIEALQRHGPIWGLALTIRRLARCHPLGGFGFDPVPQERPSLKRIVSRFFHASHHSA